MKNLSSLLFIVFSTAPLFAEETRHLDAHEHGVGQLNMAFDGQKIAMEFRAPGADLVGFEYAAKSAEDRAKIDTAVATLARPLELFALPSAASCSVVKASAGLEADADHEDHQEEHTHDDHDHEENDEAHAEANGHTEFHAQYLINCANPAAVTEISFAYFDIFENALEVEVQVITESGAAAYEVERAVPMLDLRSMF